MLTYSLDNLGAFGFEFLAQSVLKAELGLGLEAWGGRSDLGRDLYSESSLRFPSRDGLQAGPFVFQAKFVENANAAGAKPGTLLLDSVGREARKITKLIAAGKWKPPAHYCIVTNVSMDAALRDKVSKKIAGVLPASSAHSLDGTDVCCMLDSHPSIRRSHPEIMGLRDLTTLISDALGKEVMERSLAWVADSAELASVFVSTAAYRRSWHVLREHHFLVLDGPPEMGKTAIARMIGLAQLADCWDVIDCRSPDDVFRVISSETPQLFVADDAFGRTEFDPGLGVKWERDLPRLLKRVDSQHWLIWTTRKHILSRALQRMDLGGEAEGFPSPSEVTVDASDLDIKERARMLYAHAKAADLSSELKKLVRGHAELIVRDRHFTPERIRRFICTGLERVASEHPACVESDIEGLVAEAIRNPTKGMSITFDRLTVDEKWIPISMLECDCRNPRIEDVRRVYECHRGPVSTSEFEERISLLEGSFLRVRALGKSSAEATVDWIHPSYRDLVVDVLASDLALQSQFLEKTSLSGVKLALSEAGGTAGERFMPLVASEGSWSRLVQTCCSIAEQASDVQAVELLQILRSALFSTLTHEDHSAEVEILLRQVCGVLVDVWNRRSEPLWNVLVLLFEQTVSQLDPPGVMPHLEATWLAETESIAQWTSGESKFQLESYSIDGWIAVARIVEQYETDTWDSPEGRGRFRQLGDELLEVMDGEGDWEVIGDSAEDYESEAERLESLADVIPELCAEAGLDEERCAVVTAGLRGRAHEHRADAPPEQEPDVDYDDFDDGPRGSVVESFGMNDIDALFSDL